ncbi:hypothetical protein Nepgr_033554 [Nepenthes gracilis]|uniref:Uncharacterized protein n=1 Tax=Nepenthes gracilis TaxID=150966 RepID=A0AAD3Y8G8_NEPGR|nr:hypothetical protein Nepgr_033554 [Nepenthes gracilis]
MELDDGCVTGSGSRRNVLYALVCLLIYSWLSLIGEDCSWRLDAATGGWLVLDWMNCLVAGVSHKALVLLILTIVFSGALSLESRGSECRFSFAAVSY